MDPLLLLLRVGCFHLLKLDDEVQQDKHQDEDDLHGECLEQPGAQAYLLEASEAAEHEGANPHQLSRPLNVKLLKVWLRLHYSVLAGVYVI